MTDFISFTRDTRTEVSILPEIKETAYTRIRVREPLHGFSAERVITHEDVRNRANIDDYIDKLLSEMYREVMTKKEAEYASRHAAAERAEKRRELDKFWRNSTPSKLTEDIT